MKAMLIDYLTSKYSILVCDILRYSTSVHPETGQNVCVVVFEHEDTCGEYVTEHVDMWDLLEFVYNKSTQK